MHNDTHSGSVLRRLQSIVRVAEQLGFKFEALNTGHVLIAAAIMDLSAAIDALSDRLRES